MDLTLSLCIQEMFTPSAGFKLMHSRLKVHWTIRQQRDEITFDRLKMAALIIFGLPREKFSLAEVSLAYIITCTVSINSSMLFAATLVVVGVSSY